MKPRRMGPLMMGILLLSGCASGVHQTDRRLTDIPVRSSESVDVAPLNDAIENALRNGEKWPFGPVQLVIRVLNAEEETREINIHSTADRLENPQHIEVTITRDGFLDDSVRGDWHYFLLIRKQDGSWRIAKAKRSQRCWRPENDDFQARKCP
jgi:autonomous glycyl radical cofactor GrcA